MSSQSRTYRVLVVEDNRADARLIEEAFSECSYQCELKCEASRSDALKLLSMEHFDLMLTDFGTDQQDAERFMHAVRAVNSRMPIIVLSGVLDPSIPYQVGANAFVRKDSNMEMFFGKIRDLMRFWTEVAELPPPPVRK